LQKRHGNMRRLLTTCGAGLEAEPVSWILFACGLFDDAVSGCITFIGTVVIMNWKHFKMNGLIKVWYGIFLEETIKSQKFWGFLK
jgi:hypothetical protein